jgi:uncharacterized repeat protein (TIGR03803 family)
MEKLSFAKMASIAFGFCVASAILSPAQTLTTIVTFDGANGEQPYFGSLTQDTNGNIYGTTLTGGTDTGNCSNGQGFGCGTIFQITPQGAFSTLYNFCSQPGCSDGLESFSALAHDSSGNLYGTTDAGGATFAGTVFKITPEGVLTTVYNFCGQSNCADGSSPTSGLVSLSGDLYGTTSSGGANNAGTIFKVTPSGLLTTLYSFCSQPNCADGETVYDTMIEANGKLWGTTQAGGASNFGTVFFITPAGRFTTVHSFNSVDGAAPIGGLLRAANGNFYGTTSAGGTRDDGTIFKMTATGKLTTIYNFCANTDCPDGVAPLGGLVQGTNGNFFGTTVDGGMNFRGTIFEITPAGKLTTIYNFCSQTNCADGEFPYAGLIQASDGKLYGTTLQGGDLSCSSPNGCGTVFSLTE